MKLLLAAKSVSKQVVFSLPSSPPNNFGKKIYHYLHANPFLLHLSYFVFLSLLGFLLLDLVLPMKDRPTDSRSVTHLDLLFMSVSATTVSSMTAIEMESFSNSQLTVLTILMLLGGEVFVSMLPLLFSNINITNYNNNSNINDNSTTININSEDTTKFYQRRNGQNIDLVRRYLGYAVLGYLVVVHAAAASFILVYLFLFPGQKAVLDRKGLGTTTFAFFVVVSSFSNCGFVPTNENMIVFRNGTGLLLAVAVVVLLGNTVYPIGLRFAVWGLSKISKREEFRFILKSGGGSSVGYDDHLMGVALMELAMLGATVTGFILLQFILFCYLEWQSEVMEGMSSCYQKVVAALFMSVNSRHAGESVVDLSALSPAILVLYVVMMYLPPYTTFLPTQQNKYKSDSAAEEEEEEEGGKDKLEEEGAKKKKKNLLVFSQLSYLAIFVIIICITERNHISKDPLNFNVLNIVFEVISAYGNVGFSTGYSCQRQLLVASGELEQCKDLWIGFSGKWTNKGKLTLMAVMLFGRLKKFSVRINGAGKAWKLR